MYVAGPVGRGVKERFAEGDAKAQTIQALENLKAILKLQTLLWIMLSRQQSISKDRRTKPFGKPENDASKRNLQLQF